MVNLMYEIGKVDGEEIREEENRQKSAYDDRDGNNILIDNFGRNAICGACIACQEETLDGLMNRIYWILVRSLDLFLFWQILA